MTKAHTPGPWYVSGSDPNGGMVFGGDNTPVAAWPTHTDSAVQMANARLIAEAPDLLDWLTKAAQMAERQYKGGQDAPLRSAWEWLRANAQAAIDAATA